MRPYRGENTTNITQQQFLELRVGWGINNDENSVTLRLSNSTVVEAQVTWRAGTIVNVKTNEPHNNFNGWDIFISRQRG